MTARGAMAVVAVLLMTQSHVTKGQEMRQANEPKDIFGGLLYFHKETPKIIEQRGERFQVLLRSLADPQSVRPFVETVSGSGCVVLSNGVPFLVTAAHVARDFEDGGSVSLRAKDGNGKSFSIAELVGHAPPFEWVMHESADVAVLRIDVRHVHSDRPVNLEPFDPSLFADKPGELRVGSRLGIVGFPLDLVAVEGPFSPIEKDFAVASSEVQYPRADNGKMATFLLVQDPIAQGFSGGPVFTLNRIELGGGAAIGAGGFSCVGIAHGTIGDQTGGKFGAITPSSFVLETLSKAASAK